MNCSKGLTRTGTLKNVAFRIIYCKSKKKKREGPGLLIRSWAETSLKLCRNSGTT